jgi:ribose transport system substrate-binding protein
MKKIISLLMVVTIAIALLGGCSSKPSSSSSSSSSAATSKKTSGFVIGFSNGYFGNTWRSQLVSDFTTEANSLKAQGVISKYTIANTNNDSTEQINQINSMLNSGVNAIIIDPVSPTAVSSVVAAAKAKGVLVVIANDPAAYAGTYCVAGNNSAWFDIQTKWMTTQLNGTGNIVYISGVAGNAADTLRTTAMNTDLAKYPNIKILSSSPGGWSETTAQSIATTMLSTYGTKINGILTQDVMAEGIIKAYKNAGKTLPIMTGDYTKSFFNVWKATPGLDTIGVPYAPGSAADALGVTVKLLQGKQLKSTSLVANPMDPTLKNTILVDPPYVVTTQGDQNASWMQGYPNTKAITLDTAISMLKSDPDTTALDGVLTDAQLNTFFQ